MSAFVIYSNLFQIAEEFGFKMETRCDVEPILHLFGKGGIEMATTHLDAEFAFCLIDSKKQRIYLARDPFGVRPLFRLYSECGVLGVCSEAKGIYSTFVSFFYCFFAVF